MTTGSFSLQTASNGPIVTHCTIPIVSTLITPIYSPRGFLIACSTLKFFILRMTSKFPRISASSDEFNALTESYHTPTFKTPFPPRAPEFSRNNLHDEGTESKRYELVYESKKV